MNKFKLSNKTALKYETHSVMMTRGEISKLGNEMMSGGVMIMVGKKSYKVINIYPPVVKQSTAELEVLIRLQPLK